MDLPSFSEAQIHIQQVGIGRQTVQMRTIYPRWPVTKLPMRTMVNMEAEICFPDHTTEGNICPFIHALRDYCFCGSGSPPLQESSLRFPDAGRCISSTVCARISRGNTCTTIRKLVADISRMLPDERFNSTVDNNAFALWQRRTLQNSRSIRLHTRMKGWEPWNRLDWSKHPRARDISRLPVPMGIPKSKLLQRFGSRLPSSTLRMHNHPQTIHVHKKRIFILHCHASMALLGLFPQPSAPNNTPDTLQIPFRNP